MLYEYVWHISCKHITQHAAAHTGHNTHEYRKENTGLRYSFKAALYTHSSKYTKAY